MKRNKTTIHLYKTRGFYTQDEIKDIVEDYREQEPERSEENALEEAARLINEVEWYEFMSDVTHYDKNHPDQTYEVQIHFGTWYGAQEGTVTRPSLKGAILAACYQLQDIKIYEDGYGKLIVEGAHHDSSDNHMEIFLKESGRRKNVHFGKKVYGHGY